MVCHKYIMICRATSGMWPGHFFRRLGLDVGVGLNGIWPYFLHCSYFGSNAFISKGLDP